MVNEVAEQDAPALSRDDLTHLAEIANRLDAWPARNPVMRAALDRARAELLRLAQR